MSLNRSTTTFPLGVPAPPGTKAGNNRSVVTDIKDFLDDRHGRFIAEIIGEYQAYDPSSEDRMDMQDLLGIVENILHVATKLIEEDIAQKQVPEVAWSPNPSSATISGSASYLISWISCQMTCEALCGRDSGEKLRSIFRKLSRFSWATQIVLVLAAFASQYGDFCYVVEATGDDRNVNSRALLNGLNALKRQLIADETRRKVMASVNSLARNILELTSRLVLLSKLATEHRERHAPALSRAFGSIPAWSCQTIIVIVAAAVYFSRLIDFEDRFSAPGVSDLQSHVSKLLLAVNNVIKDCNNQIDVTLEYQKHVKKIEAPKDIVDLLRALVNMRKDPPYDQLVIGPNDAPVSLETFRRKSVILIISSFKLSPDDILALRNVHNDPKRYRRTHEGEDVSVDTERSEMPKLAAESAAKLYEIVWIPIVDPVTEDMQVPAELKSMMPWHRVERPYLVNNWAIKFIKEEWYFRREPIVVVLNPLGRVENINALPIIRIWGAGAFPYTGNESTHPWKDPFSWVELVINEPVVLPETLDWIKSEHVIFYGGEGVKNLPTDIVSAVPGTSISFVHIEKTQLFFTRLKSCLVCRVQWLQLQSGLLHPLDDQTLNELCAVYTTCRTGGFAILTKGSTMVHSCHFRIALNALTEVQKWTRTTVVKDAKQDYVEMYVRYCKEQADPSPCKHFYLPDIVGWNPEDMDCPTCSRYMNYDISYRCCHGQV